MRLIYPGLVLTLIAGAAGAQGNWQPQASPSPTPPPVYYPPPAPTPAPRPPSSKERPPKPRSDPSIWITDADYPPSSTDALEQGTTGFRLFIGKDGRVLRCDITETSGHPALDEATCRLLTQRATFWPARGPDGKPKVDTYNSRIHWVLGGEYPDAPLPFTETISFYVETDGKVTACNAIRDGAALPPSKGCNPETYGPVYKPFTDSAGKPVRKKVTQTTILEVSNSK